MYIREGCVSFLRIIQLCNKNRPGANRASHSSPIARRAVDEAAALGVEREAYEPDGATVGQIWLRVALRADLRKCLVNRLVDLQLKDEKRFPMATRFSTLALRQSMV